jgi:autotransporter-associated beta strand protein
MPHEALATNSNWTPTTGVWNTVGNWSAGAPVASGDTANFTGNAPTTVTLSAPVTISVLNITAGTYTYNFGSNFTLDGATGAAGFNNTSGNNAIFTQSAGTLTFGSATVNQSAVNLGSSLLTATGGGTTITFATGGNAGSSTISILAGTNLNFTGTGTGGTATINSSGGAINISGASGGVSLGSLNDTTGGAETVTLGANTLSVGSNNNTTTYDGTISGTGGITKTGTGTFTLTHANTYSGATTINGGTISVGALNNLGTGAGGLVFGGGTLLDTTGLNFTQAVTLNGGGGTISTSAGATTLSGAVTGTGGLTKTGTANLTLSGANTYSGGTTISAGTATLGATNALGTGAILDNAALVLNNFSQTAASLAGTGTVNLGTGTLTINGAASTTASGVISGTGNLVQTGTGTLTLSGANTYSGTTTLTSGVVAVSAANNLGTSGITFNGGTLSTTAGVALTNAITLNSTTNTVNTNSQADTLSGLISGPGGIFLTNGGSVVFSNAANTYAGGTSLNNVTASVANAAALGTGTISTVTNTSNTLALTGNTTVTQAGALATGSTLTVNTNANVDTMSGVVTGAGNLTKTGTGTLLLTAADTLTGVTTINSGELIVGDATHSGASLGGSASILNGALLRGHGTITGNVANSGVVAPGASIGTLTVNGNYTQAANGMLFSEISPTVNSVLAVNGAAALAGTLAVLPDSGLYTPYSKYTLLTATTGVTGTFATVTNLAPNIVGFSISYLPNSVIATALPAYTFVSGQKALGASANNIRVAAALDAAYPRAAGDFQTVLNSIYVTTPQQQQQTFNQLSGEMRSNFATVGVANVTALHDTLLNRLDSRQGLNTAAAKGDGMPNMFQVASQDTDDMGPLWGPASSNPYIANDGVSTWIRGFGNFGDAGSYQGSTPFQYQTGGVIAGADKKIADGTLLGAAVSYDHTNISSSLDESGNIDSYRIMVYGDQVVGPVMLDGNLGYGYSTYHDQRSLVFPGVSRSATSSHDGNDYTADLGVSHTFKDIDTDNILPGKLALQPRLGAEYIGINQGSFSEGNANSIGLDTQTRDLNAFRTTLGGKAVLDLPVTERGTAISPELHLAWLHDFADVNQTVTQNFTAAPGTPFTVQGVRPGRDAALVGTGLTVAFNAQSSLFADYDAAVRDRETDHTISAGFRYKW